jgi:hypothetical protein
MPLAPVRFILLVRSAEEFCNEMPPQIIYEMREASSFRWGTVAGRFFLLCAPSKT